MGKHTIRDIARMAGVSRSTVSLVLNDSPSVNAQTRQRVQEVIARVRYRPSAQARGLVSRRSRALALVFPESDEIFRNFYLADTVAGVLEAIIPRDYTLIIEPATPQFIRNRVYESLFDEQRVDGALAVWPRADDTFVARMRDAGHPLCLINSRLDGAASVMANNLDGARLAARHLAALGHRDIACLRGPDHLAPGRDRHRGFVEALDEMAIPMPPPRCVFGSLTELSGYEGAGRLLRQWATPPTALFTANDMMALGAIRRLREAGLRVPDDVAVIGADDILLAAYASPALTTIRQSLSILGRLAAEVLLNQIDHPGRPPEQQTIPAPLIIRESCGAQSRPT